MTYKFDKIKILVIDGMTPMRDIVKSVLNVFGVKQILTSETAEQGFEILCREDPDLIITDWMNGSLSGLDFIQKVRKDPNVPNPYVPILMMTGYSSRPRVEQARDIGVTEFLVKPFSAETLYTRIANIIENPRQFVDTGEFFGPDRRRRVGEDYDGPRKREEDENKFYVDLSPQDHDKANELLKQLQKDAENLQG